MKNSDSILQLIDRPIALVRQALTAVAESALELRAEHTFGSRYIPQMVQGLEPHGERLLLGERGIIVGIGLVWQAGPADDDESGMLWWRGDDGVLARKVHVFNPESDTFYDYSRSEWYTAARETDGLAIVGPFIDAWGTDDHTITPSLAIVDNGELVGVAAADLDVQLVTAELAAILRPFGDYVLVDKEDRVVASNYSLLSPGLRLEPFLAKSGLRVSERVPTLVSGWFLLQLTGPGEA